jgi:hypothetical protein
MLHVEPPPAGQLLPLAHSSAVLLDTPRFTTVAPEQKVASDCADSSVQLSPIWMTVGGGCACAGGRSAARRRRRRRKHGIRRRGNAAAVAVVRRRAGAGGSRPCIDASFCRVETRPTSEGFHVYYGTDSGQNKFSGGVTLRPFADFRSHVTQLRKFSCARSAREGKNRAVKSLHPRAPSPACPGQIATARKTISCLLVFGRDRTLFPAQHA